MTDYTCRSCGKFVAASADTTGKVRVLCRFCGTSQWIFLGNPGGKPLPRELQAVLRSG